MNSKRNLGTFCCSFCVVSSCVSYVVCVSTSGLVVADALSHFSYDILRVILGYLHGAVDPGSKPKFLFKFGVAGEKDGEFKNAVYSLAISPHDGTIWTGDARGCQIFSPKGEFIKFGAKGGFTSWCSGTLFEEGEVFMCDYQGHRIVVARPDGTFIRSFGSYGTGDGKFNTPFGACSDGNGQLIVPDLGNNRVLVWKRDGTFVRHFGSEGNGNGQLKYPVASLVRGNEVWVSDQLNHRIEVLLVPCVLFMFFGSGFRFEQWSFHTARWWWKQGLGPRTIQ